MSDGAKPRRLTNTSDCSRRASRAAMDARSVSPMPSSERAARLPRQDDRRQRSARIRALRKVEAPVALLARVQPRFERRRRAAEHDGNAPAAARARSRHRARGSARCPAACTTHPVPRRRRRVPAPAAARTRQARPEHELRRARRGGQPLGAALAARQARCAASRRAAPGDAARTRAKSCGVRLISGTSISTWRPCASTRAAAAR